MRLISRISLIKEGEIKDTVEVADDIFIEYGEDNEIMDIEIWQARKKLERWQHWQHLTSVLSLSMFAEDPSSTIRK